MAGTSFCCSKTAASSRGEATATGRQTFRPMRPTSPPFLPAPNTASCFAATAPFYSGAASGRLRNRRLVLPLVPRIERSIGPAAFAARAAPDGRLRPVQGARSAWRRAVRRSIVAPAASVVIVSDVRDCYPSVGERALEALGCSGALASFLRALAGAGVRGLPIADRASGTGASARTTADRRSRRVSVSWRGTARPPGDRGP